VVTVNGAEPKAPAPVSAAGGSVSRVVIVGNGIAGVTAADHIRRHHAECEIDLVTDERHPFYNRTGISRLISSRTGIHRMYLLPDSWYEERRIGAWLNTRVTRIDREARHAVLGTGDVLPYDVLVLATGSTPFVPQINGFGLDGSFCLRGADDAMMIRSFAQSEGARKALVAGGGVLGLEAADELQRLGLEVTVLERAAWLAPAQVDETGGRILGEQIRRRSIETLLGTTIDSLTGSRKLEGVQLSDGTSRDADLVVVCAGVTPNVGLAVEAGLEVSRGVMVDDQMRTSDERIFAAGDVAEHAGLTYGVWPAAVEQAEVAAINVLGASRRYRGSTAPTRLKLAGLDLTSIGRPHADRDGDVDVAIEHADGDRYRKLVIADGRIEGGVLLGHPEHAEAVLAACREKRDIRGHVELLREGNWDVLNESHFERAVAAPLSRHASSLPAVSA
jgi:NAD(P)H-nitrite reductase large subunit